MEYKAFLLLVAGRQFLSVLVVVLVVLLSGCTSALWDKEAFAHHYGPAKPVNLHLFYSQERKDILVQYDESKDGERKSRIRCYWLEPNALRGDRKPHFVSPRATNGLVAIAVGEVVAHPAQLGLIELCAVVRRSDDLFTLYSGTEQLDSSKLPTYTGASRRVKQVLLTPFTVAVDATIVGAVIGYYSAPSLFANLSR